MKTTPYVHNRELFRSHFRGQGLPAFRGARMQRGHGLMSKIKRYAVPLLLAGAKVAGPHIQRGATTLATSAARSIAPNNPAMQKVVGNLAGHMAGKALNHAIKKRPVQKKRKPKSRLSSHSKLQRSTRNIFT